METNSGHGKYLTRLDQIEHLAREREVLEEVVKRFAFRANEYYLSLIDWTDPADPIRRAIIPRVDELDEWGRLDPSNEGAYTVMPGLEHKYDSTVLLLVSNVCEGICRYCFRKRVFMGACADRLQDIPAAIEYIRSHKQVTNVLLTGGDPLTLATSKLTDIIHRLRELEHVQIIRIGTRMLSFNPYRILDDASLLEMIERFSTPRKKIYVITHFIHPRELTTPAMEAITRLQKAGAITANQAPLLRGINDNPEVLAELLRQLSFAGNPLYYVFQCRPAVGNRAFTVPIEEGYEIVEQAKARVSGLAKRLRYVLSHASGKIEIVGKGDGRTYFKYHRAADDADSGRFLVFESNPAACWLDDYDETTSTWPADMPYRFCGPE